MKIVLLTSRKKYRFTREKLVAYLSNTVNMFKSVYDKHYSVKLDNNWPNTIVKRCVFILFLTFPRPEVNGQVYNTGSAPAGECSFSSIFGRLPVVSNLTTLCLQGFPPFIKVFSVNNKGHFDTKIQKISHSKTRHHRTHSITLRAQINDSDNCVTFAAKCQLPCPVGHVVTLRSVFFLCPVSKQRSAW